MSIFWMAGTRDFDILRFWKNARVPFFKNPQKNGVWKNQVLPGSKIPLLAIHKIISHVWEDAPRKVNNEEPDLRFFHWNFWPVIGDVNWEAIGKLYLTFSEMNFGMFLYTSIMRPTIILHKRVLEICRGADISKNPHHPKSRFYHDILRQRLQNVDGKLKSASLPREDMIKTPPF